MLILQELYCSTCVKGYEQWASSTEDTVIVVKPADLKIDLLPKNISRTIELDTRQVVDCNIFRGLDYIVRFENDKVLSRVYLKQN